MSVDNDLIIAIIRLRLDLSNNMAIGDYGEITPNLIRLGFY